MPNHHAMLGYIVAVSLVVTTASLDFKAIKRELGRDFDWKLLKDYFQFHLYVNPHPLCALADEPCTLDNHCCRGFECKMAVDQEGIKNTCQPRVSDNDTSSDSEDPNESDILWTIGTPGTGSDESSNSLLAEIYRSRLEKVKQDEDKLLNDQQFLIKELQKPLTLEEMRDLQLGKEAEDYKRDKELKELREWVKMKELEDTIKKENEKALEKIAKERVANVLKEEERQKLEMFKKIQDSVRKDKENNPY